MLGELPSLGSSTGYRSASIWASPPVPVTVAGPVAVGRATTQFASGRGRALRPVLAAVLVAGGCSLGVAGAVLLSESPASAATCNDSWVGSAGGDWNTASNWSTNSVPTSSSDVCIGVAPSVGGTYTVTLNTSTQVAALTIGGAGGTQTLQIGTAGALLLSGGTVTNGANGAIANQGTFTVEAGGLGAQGTFNQDAGTTSGNPITINDANLNFTNTGASSFSFTSAGGHLSGNMAAGQSVAINSATVTVAGPLINAGVIQASGTGSTLNVSGGTLTNTGTIEADAGSTGAFTLDGTYDNQGAAPGGIVDDASMTLNGVDADQRGGDHGGERGHPHPGGRHGDQRGQRGHRQPGHLHGGSGRSRGSGHLQPGCRDDLGQPHHDQRCQPQLHQHRRVELQLHLRRRPPVGEHGRRAERRHQLGHGDSRRSAHQCRCHPGLGHRVHPERVGGHVDQYRHHRGRRGQHRRLHPGRHL